MTMLSALSRPFSQTRPVVKAQNAQSSHSTCNATSTMVMVARIEDAAEKFNDRQSEHAVPSPAAVRPFKMEFSIARSG